MAKPSCVISGPLQTEKMPDGRRRLLRDLIVKAEGSTPVVLARKDFTTDFSSIPWFGRFLVRWSKVDVAGVAHDLLYQTGTSTRKTADEVWRQVAMAGEHCATPLQARICWMFLRGFSYRAWKSYRNQDWRSLETK